MFGLIVGVSTYVVLCVLTGLYGSQRRLGFIGATILAFLVTPIPVLIVLVFTAPKDESEHAIAE